MRKWYGTRLLPALLLFCLNTAFTQNAAEERQNVRLLSLEDAVASALENNSGIKNAKSALDLLKTKRIFSWNSASPSLKLNGSYTDDLKNEVSALSLSGTINVALSANLASEIQSARLNYEKGRLSYEQTLRNVECSVRKTFYALLYERENIALQKRHLQTSETQYRQNQEKFRNGSVSELDALTSRVNYEQKKPAVEQAELTFENDLDAFKQLIGIAEDVKVELNGSLDNAAAVRHIDFSVSDKALPSVAEAEINAAIAKNALLSSRFYAYSPSISGGYTYGKSKNSAFDRWTEINQLNIGVSIPLDGVFPWSQQAVGIKSAKTSLMQAKENLANEKTAAAVKNAGYIRKINQAVSQIDSLKANVELAEQSYKMTRAAYDYGRKDLLSLQNAADNLLSAEVSLKMQMYTLISAIFDLENALGIEFGTIAKKAGSAE